MTWCLYRSRRGGDAYLESGFCWKTSYHFNSLYPHGQGGGRLAKCEQVLTRRRGIKNNRKFANIFCEWPLVLLAWLIRRRQVCWKEISMTTIIHFLQLIFVRIMKYKFHGQSYQKGRFIFLPLLINFLQRSQ